MLELNTVYNMDCMEGMAQIPDGYFELAIVDPPYGIYNKTSRGGERSPKKYKIRVERLDFKPDREYWAELFRVSNNQIVCGGNYYTDQLPANNAWIFWYKHQPLDNYADGEFIWTSFMDKQGKIFDYPYYGTINSDKYRFHKTQKPIVLYKWLLKNYANPDDKILDTHMGSGSSIIACHDMGFEYMAFEIDKDYYEAAMKRINDHKAQVQMELPTETIEQCSIL